MFSVILASTQNWGIGYRNQIPWHIPSDMKFFKYKTSTTKDPNQMNAVIMGRKTWESIGCKRLPNRLNIVITSKPNNDGEQLLLSFVSSFEEALRHASQCYVETIFVIGGAQVYAEAFKHPKCQTIYWTKIHNNNIECDTFAPMIPAEFTQVTTSEPKQVEDGFQIEFCTFQYTNQEEEQYLSLLKEIIYKGSPRTDRTLVGTLATFGKSMKFNLRNNQFPLLTTKRVFWKGVAEELLWFISGSTNAKILQDKGIKIWDGNASREYLDSIGLTTREEGDLGPVYGFQWRHFGATYTTMHADYTGQGIDQLANVIETIKKNPNDRRIILSAWNPNDLSQMALPPCHMFCQFFVCNGELSCQMYQRSCDMGLGVPFNIASYALLTNMIAQVCGLKAGDFIHVMGDVHIYQNHLTAVEEQVKRRTRPFPKLLINPDKMDIDQFCFEDFQIVDYYPHQPITMTMAV